MQISNPNVKKGNLFHTTEIAATLIKGRDLNVKKKSDKEREKSEIIDTQKGSQENS